jgi:hypothetical protein
VVPNSGNQVVFNRGNWLVPNRGNRAIVLQASWDAYTHAVLEAAEPEAVLCIGIGVVRALRTRLDTIGTPWAGVHQPQAHLSAAKHREIQINYGVVCADPTEIRRVPAVV